MDFETALRKNIEGEVRFDAGARVLYSTDASNYQVYPQGVVLPKNEADVIAAVQLCRDHGVPITARGGGSGLAGQAIGPGLIIDSSKFMHATLNLDTPGKRARVQPGAVLGLLNIDLREKKLQFGPDPASAERATIGGMIGTNATGAHSIRYGMTSDNVLAVRCVLADGSVREFGAGDIATWNGDPLSTRIFSLARDARELIAQKFPRVWRRASGYNLDYICEQLALADGEPDPQALFEWNRERAGSNYLIHREMVARPNLAPLITGSEGTLAVLLDATLRLVDVPSHKALVLATFSCDLAQAMRHVPALLTSNPSSMELLGDQLLRNAHALPEFAQLMPWANLNAEATLAIEYDGASESEVDDAIAQLQMLIAREHIPCTLQPLRDKQAQANVWTVRKMGLAILTSVRGDHKPITVVEDVAVPVARLDEFVREIKRIFAENGTSGAFYAHASAGVLHVRPLVNLRTVAGLETMHRIGRATLELCARLGGAMSGEHGDGYERTSQNVQLFGAKLTKFFGEIKHAFDPSDLLNPSKKVNPLPEEQLETMMKLGPFKHSTPIKTSFIYGDAGGIHKLSEECAGTGVCRKHDTGAMCPSYRATRDEAHSTRGRANLLREYMTGQADHAPALAMDDVKAALDLCVSCKACVRECASRVDMAKMKSDFLQVYHDTRGLPLRSWVMGRIATFNKLGAIAPGLTNFFLRSGWLKRMLRIAPQRQLPMLAAQSFDTWWSAHRPAHSASAQTEVVLFVDTFARYNHPQVAIAAVHVLEQLGAKVVVPQWKCCGRPLVSTGQPRAALSHVKRNVQLLAPYARRGVPILGLEPSCISMLREDYPDLLAGDEAQSVAAAVTSVEEFVVQHIPINIAKTGERQVLLHAHCHQKSGYGSAATREALTKLGYAVGETAGTCCGMAGSFGFEAEHYDISQRIGELNVLPAARGAKGALCATGASCRQQIADFAGREAKHPIELIAEGLQQWGAGFDSPPAL